MDCIEESAPKAVPSTTSMTIRPINDWILGWWPACTAILPPRLCPIRTMGVPSGTTRLITVTTSLKDKIDEL
ncbi:unnamed protein product, partial [Nesidiocoris tenuis]